MSVMSPADSSLFEINLQFLGGVDPALAAQLRGMHRLQTVTRPVIENGAIVDIDLGDGRLYGRNGAAFAEEQVASYLAQPTRIAVAAPQDSRLDDPCSIDMIGRFEARFAADGATLPELLPAGRSGLLLVAGVGLGFHLERLIAETGPRHVVMVEPFVEFLCHATAAIDWRAMYGRCEARGATLNIVAGGDIGDIAARLDALLAGFGETAIDGSYLYLHYRTPETEAAAARVHEFAGMQTILKGYFDDERIMVENMTANVATRDFRLIEGTMHPPLGAPAFVVGSGPSLDGSIATIRRHRGKAIIITAGSALQACLHHGIVPDYHVEKENSLVTVERLRHIMARNRDRFPDGRFSGIRLFAASTVDPGVVDLFDEVYLYLRTSLSSTEMFGAGHLAVDGTSPFVANAALMLTALLGFRDVYLFGCDCGARDGARHHSEHTVYYTRAASRDTGRVDFPHRAPANFGGEACTNSFFVWSRQIHEQIIVAAGLNVQNCSDGVRIAGAEPLRPEELKMSGPDVDRERLGAQLLNQTTWYPAGGYLDGQDVAGAVAGWRAFAKDLRFRLDALDREAGHIHEFHRGICVFLDAAASRYGGAAVLAGGTVRALPALASYWLNRAPDAASEADQFAWFRGVFRELIDGVLAEGDALMAALAERGAPAMLQSA